MNTGDFWNVDSYLAEEEQVKIAFTKKVDSYGEIADQGTEDILPDHKAMVPFWLAREFIENQIANIAIPKFFSD